MLSYEFKNKLKILFCILMTLFFFGATSFIGYLEVEEMLINNSDAFTLVRGAIITLFSPIIAIPGFILLGYVFFTGKQAPLAVQKRMAALLIIFLAGGFIAEITFSIYYTNKLDKEGFQRCRGIPIGSLPGQSVKYAKSKELCKQKRKY